MATINDMLQTSFASPPINQTSVDESTMDHNCSNDDYCPEYYDQEWIMPMILYIGSAVSLISLIENSLIFYALTQHPRRSDSYFLYLVLWAVFDMIVSISYVPVIVVDQARDRYNIPWLTDVWQTYFLEALVLCNISLSASAYLIVGMQFERYLITMRSEFMLPFVRKHRRLICVFSVALAVVLRAPAYFEVSLFELPPCPPSKERIVEIGLTELGQNNIYAVIMFWTRGILCTYLPFFALFFFNCKILFRLKLLNRRAKLFNQAVNLRKQQARSATRTFVLIVSVYLVSNILNIIVTCWEFIDFHSLHYYYCQVHLIATDLVSLLTIVGCALRLPIYLVSNDELRQVICCALFRRRSTNAHLPTSDSRGFTLTTDHRVVSSNSPSQNAPGMSQTYTLTGFIEQLAAAMVTRGSMQMQQMGDGDRSRCVSMVKMRVDRKHGSFKISQDEDGNENDVLMNRSKSFVTTTTPKLLKKESSRYLEVMSPIKTVSMSDHDRHRISRGDSQRSITTSGMVILLQHDETYL